MTEIANPKLIHRKSDRHTVTAAHLGNVYNVVSGTSGNGYKVVIQHTGHTGACSCNWGKYRPARNGWRSGCSHVLAVFEFLARSSDRRTSAWATTEQATRQHHPMINLGDGVIMTARRKS